MGTDRYMTAHVYGHGCVYGDGCVWDNGRVYGYGCIYENGHVIDNGCVCGNAYICDHVFVSYNGRVTGTAHVNGHANITVNGLVASDADYTDIKGFGTEYRNTTFFRCKDGRIRVQCGCFHGTINQFREQAKKTRGGQISKDYLLIADLMEDHFKNL